MSGEQYMARKVAEKCVASASCEEPCLPDLSFCKDHHHSRQQARRRWWAEKGRQWRAQHGR